MAMADAAVSHHADEDAEIVGGMLRGGKLGRKIWAIKQKRMAAERKGHTGEVLRLEQLVAACTRAQQCTAEKVKSLAWDSLRQFLSQMTGYVDRFPVETKIVLCVRTSEQAVVRKDPASFVSVFMLRRNSSWLALGRSHMLRYLPSH